MPQTADNLAMEFQLTRESCDRFAAASQSKYAAAKDNGFYDDEILTVTIPGSRRQPDVTIEEDEHPRPETTTDGLAKLRPEENE